MQMFENLIFVSYPRFMYLIVLHCLSFYFVAKTIYGINRNNVYTGINRTLLHWTLPHFSFGLISLRAPPFFFHCLSFPKFAGPRSGVRSASDSRARDPGFDTRSGHITFVFSFRWLKKGSSQLLAKYVHEVLVNRLGGLSLPRKSVVRLTDLPDMTLAVYRRKTTTQNNNSKILSGGQAVLNDCACSWSLLLIYFMVSAYF